MHAQSYFYIDLAGALYALRHQNVRRSRSSRARFGCTRCLERACGSSCAHPSCHWLACRFRSSRGLSHSLSCILTSVNYTVTLAQEKDQNSSAENATQQKEVTAQGDNVTKPAGQENGAEGEKMDVDQKPTESHETTNGPSIEKNENKVEATAPQEPAVSALAGSKEEIPAAVPPAAPTVEDEKEEEAPAPASNETNGAAEPAPAVNPPPPTNIVPSDEAAAAQTGEKRKAEEAASADPVPASNEESEEQGAKKPKVAEEEAQENGAEPVKRKPGRPPKSGNGAAKKEKKVPAVGKAERRTRSQGGV
ncbi:hypothetical protein DH86_00003567 [Scytalidium sp. 3C]|nr:hypothetical protein DH86_00003567 [Scytalidium sp. 3C]